MKKVVLLLLNILLLFLTVTSCDWLKDKTKQAIHKTGEIVGKTSSEFGDGVYKGVKKTFENEVLISDKLKGTGIEFGEVVIASSETGTDNILIAYVIFNTTFDEEIILKIFNENGKEYGRLIQKLSGKKGSAQYIEFVFDEHVSIGSKGTIRIDPLN
jgi:hypothetical protein